MENASQENRPTVWAWQVRSRMAQVGALAEALEVADRRLVVALVKARELNAPALEAGLQRVRGDLDVLVAGLQPTQFFQSEAASFSGVPGGVAPDEEAQ